MGFLSAVRLIILGLVMKVNGEVDIDKSDNSCVGMKIDFTDTCNGLVAQNEAAVQPKADVEVGLNQVRVNKDFHL